MSDLQVAFVGCLALQAWSINSVDHDCTNHLETDAKMAVVTADRYARR
jgi:hypothetical protein